MSSPERRAESGDEVVQPALLPAPDVPESRCLRCGRRLTDPVYAARQRGPVCGGRAGARRLDLTPVSQPTGLDRPVPVCDEQLDLFDPTIPAATRDNQTEGTPMSSTPAAIFECRRCGYSTPWTDGRDINSGDERNEFWCQVCGHENPLPDDTANARIPAAFTVDGVRWYQAADGRYCTTSAGCTNTDKHLASYSQARGNGHLDVFSIARLHAGKPFLDVDYVAAEATR